MYVSCPHHTTIIKIGKCICSMYISCPHYTTIIKIGKCICSMYISCPHYTTIIKMMNVNTVNHLKYIIQASIISLKH